MQPTIESLPSAAHEASPFKRARMTIGTIGLTCAMLLAPEIAHAEDNTPIASSVRESMSPKEAYDTCHDSVRVVAHETSDPRARSRFTVNTLRWIKHEINQGHNIIEVDTQVSSDNEFFGFHDRLLNANTRNGSGVAHQKRGNYIAGLKTLSGDKLSRADDLIGVLQRNPDIQLQHEFKDYDQQWTPTRLEKWYQTFSEAGVLSQINVSSASQRIIKWFSTKHPDVLDKQFIGFENRLPSLSLAKRVGASQVNVTSEAGLRNGAAYLKRAKKLGLRTSVRSHPTGKGDDGATWLRAIQNDVDQIVTQGPTKSSVCRAVLRAARS